MGRKIRVVVDTNLWISTLIGKRVANATKIFDGRAVRLIWADKLTAELFAVVARPKFRKYFPEETAVRFINDLISIADHYPLADIPARCRDPKDDYLLELAHQSSADFLITGDTDLLGLKQIGSTRILTLAEFAEQMG